MKGNIWFKVAGWTFIIIGGADLVLGTTSTPLPVVGDYLNQGTDAVLIGVGAVLLFAF